MESDPEPTNSIVADRDGVILEWGSGFEATFGYTAAEAIGRKVDLIVPPALRARHWRGFFKAIETGQLRRPKVLKVPGLDKTGRIIGIHAQLSLLKDEGGAAKGVRGTLVRRSGPWSGRAWRAVLAPLELGNRLRSRSESAHE